MKTQFNVGNRIIETEDTSSVIFDINNYLIVDSDGGVTSYDSNKVNGFVIKDNQPRSEACQAANYLIQSKVQGQQEFPSYPTIKDVPWFNMVLKSAIIPGNKQHIGNKYITQRQLLLLVIVKSGGRLEYTTHKYNVKNDSIYSGNYHTLLDEAVIDFNNRCNEEGI
jgi:hypothetical protein